MDIENIFCEQKLKKLIKVDNNGRYILKNDIDALNLNSEDKKFVYRVLARRKIEIRTYDIKIEEKKLTTMPIVDDYSNLSIEKYGNLPVNIPYEEQKKKFQMMHDNNCSDIMKKKLRNELIESNVRLVGYISYKYYIMYGLSIDELNSYGYEGLICSVDSFDESLGNTFSTYAITYINNAILRGIAEICGFKHQNYLFSKYMLVKKAIELKYDQSVYDNPSLIYAIVDEMKRSFGIRDKVAARLANNLFINSASICKFDEQNVDDNEVEKEVFFNDLVVNMSEALSLLTDKEERVLRLRFGFEDGFCKTLEEIGKIVHLSSSRIGQIEQGALKKLRRPMNNKKLS